MGVSCQIMKIVAYMTEEDVPFAVPIFCRNEP
jgi:hypothetical protein